MHHFVLVVNIVANTMPPRELRMTRRRIEIANRDRVVTIILVLQRYDIYDQGLVDLILWACLRGIGTRRFPLEV